MRNGVRDPQGGSSPRGTHLLHCPANTYQCGREEVEQGLRLLAGGKARPGSLTNTSDVPEQPVQSWTGLPRFYGVIRFSLSDPQRTQLNVQCCLNLVTVRSITPLPRKYLVSGRVEH